MIVKQLLAICGVFFGCCSNVIFLELLVKHDPGCGNLVTFSQFAFIALEGFIFTHKWGTRRPNISLRDYFYLVIMFFVSSVCNNFAFDFNIPMPLHMIFRAGSLIANMIMGMIILKKRYAVSKYVSVLLITAGIVICTITSKIKQTVGTHADAVEETDPSIILFRWTMGIALLTLALFISAGMGIYQEKLYARHGKHPFEALYYTHLLPLPGFLIFSSNIVDHLRIAMNSDGYEMPFVPIAIPIVVIYLIGNVLTQFICIGSVYVLTTECKSLTVTLVVTLRKFVSLIISILYFSNEFTLIHWIGTTLVFTGTVIFTEIIPSIRNALATTSGGSATTVARPPKKKAASKVD